MNRKGVIVVMERLIDLQSKSDAELAFKQENPTLWQWYQEYMDNTLILAAEIAIKMENMKYNSQAHVPMPSINPKQLALML